MIALNRSLNDVRLRATSIEAPITRNRLSVCSLLSPEERQALDDAMLPAKAVGANKDLALEGDDVDCLYVVAEGWACRYIMTAAGGRQITSVLIPGDVGNLDTFMFDRLDYSLRTLSAAMVVSLPKRRARALAAVHPGIAQRFAALAMVENTILSAKAVSLGRRSATERLAHFLCELSVRLDPLSDIKTQFELPMTQEHLGDSLGLTSVHVNRTLQQLRKEGLVETRKGTIIVPDLGKLRSLSGFDERYLHVPAITGST